MRVFRSSSWAGLFVLLLLSNLTWSTAMQQTITLPNGETGVIDWSEGRLTAVGFAVAPSNAQSDAQGRILARRGATLDAQRMLLEMIQGVRVTAETTMIQLMANDVVRSSVEGVVQGAVIISETWDGEVFTVELQIPLEQLRDSTGQSGSGTPPVGDAPSGLVIDARDHNVTPALFVRLVDESGAEILSGISPIYSPATPGVEDPNVNPVELAMSNPFVGDTPRMIRAVGVAPNRIDLVLSSADRTYLGQWRHDSRPEFAGRAIVVAN